MNSRFRFTYQPDWRTAPVAFWVHIPVAGNAADFEPPAPLAVPHRGYSFLHVEFGEHELIFSAPAQLRHFIEVMEKKPLPTTRQLSAKRGLPVGPNGHWLSRLPAALKAPRARPLLVKHLKAVEVMVLKEPRNSTSHPRNPRTWPGYPE